MIWKLCKKIDRMMMWKFNLLEIKKTLNDNCSEVAKIGVFRRGYFGGIWEGVWTGGFDPDDLF